MLFLGCCFRGGANSVLQPWQQNHRGGMSGIRGDGALSLLWNWSSSEGDKEKLSWQFKSEGEIYQTCSGE